MERLFWRELTHHNQCAPPLRHNPCYFEINLLISINMPLKQRSRKFTSRSNMKSTRDSNFFHPSQSSCLLFLRLRILRKILTSTNITFLLSSIDPNQLCEKCCGRFRGETLRNLSPTNPSTTQNRRARKSTMKQLPRGI